MERRSPSRSLRDRPELHLGLLWSPVGLPVVASNTGGNAVLEAACATLCPWHNVVHRDLLTSRSATAILAGPPVPVEQVLPAEGDRRVRDLSVIRQCDDLRNADCSSDQLDVGIAIFRSEFGPIVPGVLSVIVWVNHAGRAHPYLHQCLGDGLDIHRLPQIVQYQSRSV